MGLFDKAGDFIGGVGNTVGGIAGGLFGMLDPREKRTDVTTTTQLPLWQAQPMADLFSRASSVLMNRNASNYAPNFSAVSGMMPLQQQGIGQLTNFANNDARNLYYQGLGGISQFSNPAGNYAVNNFASGLPTATNFLQNVQSNAFKAPQLPTIGSAYDPVYQSMTNQATKAFREGVIPGLVSAGVTSGNYGNSSKYNQSVDRAVNQFGEGFSNTLANLGLQQARDTIGQSQFAEQAAQNRIGQGLQASNMATSNFLNAYNPAASRALEATSMLPMIGQLGMLGGNTLLGAGGMQRDVYNQQLADQANQYMARNQGPVQDLQSLAGILGMNAGGSSTTPTYSNPLMGTMGMLLGGAGMYGGLKQSGFGLGSLFG